MKNNGGRNESNTKNIKESGGDDPSNKDRAVKSGLITFLREPIPGIYEEILSDYLTDLIGNWENHFRVYIRELGKDAGDSDYILSHYFFRVLRNFLFQTHIGNAEKRLRFQIDLINELLEFLISKSPDDSLRDELRRFLLTDSAKDAVIKVLLAIERNLSQNNGDNGILKKTPGMFPETGLSLPVIFTGHNNPVNLANELYREILTSDEVWMIVSFIKNTGINKIIPALKGLVERGGIVKIITTSYMGTTDVKAVKRLMELDPERVTIKCSLDTKSMKLHAKAYLFRRYNGFSTAYIGSSNLSESAITYGLEWNVKITEHHNYDLIRTFIMNFETYWENPEFLTLKTEEDLKKFERAVISERNYMRSENRADSGMVFFEIKPKPFQKRILERLQYERLINNNYRNLIVAATGTGKTIMAAFDYKRFTEEYRRIHRKSGYPNLLFIAHRREILEQSLRTFRQILRDTNFGNLLSSEVIEDDRGPSHVFASIQGIQEKKYGSGIFDLPPDFYDYIVVDEFHHAAAKSYTKLLEYFTPKILLGLTATPERADGQDILKYFNGRISAEKRLYDAINEKLLSPFQYYFVSDPVSLESIRWKRGYYDYGELEEVYTSGAQADYRVDVILNTLDRYLNDDWREMIKAIGFCVSQKHAEFMADRFNEAGLPSIALISSSKGEERRSVPSRLSSGELKFVFVVDLYNEGVDIPDVNTLLFLRPTESLTIFIQQLGRGLRLSRDKEFLVVFDFVGNANRNYKFSDKLTALMGRKSRIITVEDLKNSIERGFSDLPLGCSIIMEKVAKEHILENIKNFVRNRRWLLRAFNEYYEYKNGDVSLEEFLTEYSMSPVEFYKKEIYFGELKERAAGPDVFNFSGRNPNKSLFIKGIKDRMSSSTSPKLMIFIYEFLQMLKYIPDNFDLESLLNDLYPIVESRCIKLNIPIDKGEMAPLFNMFYYTIWVKGFRDVFKDIIEDFPEITPDRDPRIEDLLLILRDNPDVLAEIQELAEFIVKNGDFMPIHIDLNYGKKRPGYSCPLEVHARYHLNQIRAAMGLITYESYTRFSEGVKYIEDINTDLLFVTLNKTEHEYSPSTMYRDYSISETLFHWQSQNSATPNTGTGKRYIEQKGMGDHKVLLFVRKYKREMGLTAPYFYLGPVQYRSHEGAKPINIIWEVSRPIPEDLLVNKT